MVNDKQTLVLSSYTFNNLFFYNNKNFTFKFNENFTFTLNLQ